MPEMNDLQPNVILHGEQLFAAGIEGFSKTAGYPVVRCEAADLPLMPAMKAAIQKIEAAGLFVARVESEDSFAIRCINDRLNQRRLSRHS